MKSIFREIAQHISHSSLKLSIAPLVIVSLMTTFMLSNAMAVNAADPKQEMKEAAEAIAEYSVEQKDAATAKAKEMMSDLDKRIESVEKRLAENWDDLKQSTREQYGDTLKTLRKKRNTLSEYYGGLKHSSKDAWQEVRDGFAKSYNQLVLSWQQAETEMQQGNEKETKQK
jgi:hypothetical protein